MPLNRVLLVTFLCCCVSMHTVFAQSSVDSLQRVLKAHAAPDTGRVNVLNLLARQLVAKNTPLAGKYSEEAMELATTLHYDRGLVLAMRNQSLVQNSKGNLDKQMDLVVDAMIIAERIKDQQLIGILLNDKGNIFIEQSQPDKAMPYLLSSLKIKQRLHDKAEVSKTLNNIGSVYISLGMPDSALYFLRQSEAIKKGLNDHRGLAFTYENIGSAYNLLSDRNAALPYLLLSAQYYEESGNLQGLTKAYMLLGETYTFLEKFKDAAAYFASADSLNKEQQNPRNEMILYKGLATLDSARHDYVHALEHYKHYAMLNADYFNVQKDQYITNTEEKYESEKKQHENVVLLQEKEIHLSTIRHQRMIEFAGILLFLILTFVTIIVFRLNRQLNIKNEESSQQNKIITEQNEKLESLLMVKDRIFSVISHDLRSPLAILDGLLFLLRDEKIPPDQFRLYTNELWRDTKNTSYMMDNLLQWASSQMKGIRVKADDIDLSLALRQEFDLLCTLAKQKDVNLYHELNSPILVYADVDMIKLVMRNLINNAVKFTPAGGQVRIFASVRNGVAEIAVEDNGTGIPDAEQSKIFSHLYYSTNGTQNEKGCGLGLPLSKEFVEHNRGTIRFISSMGQGTTFYFTLPLSTEEDMAERSHAHHKLSGINK